LEIGSDADRELGLPSYPVPLQPVGFDAIEGWRADDLGAAFAALHRSLQTEAVAPALLAAAEAISPGADAAVLRGFFETQYRPFRLAGPPGLVTGYYEPVVAGARRRGGHFQVPVYRRPDDLVTLAPDLERARWNRTMSAGRITRHGVVPYYTRAEIEAGALQGRGLELVYLDDPIDLFYMQVQGSGLVRLDGGGEIRLSYDGKNGHAYSSIGRLLIERGEIGPGDMSMATVKAWLRQDRTRARALMNENASYVFFRERPEGAQGPVGASGVALTPGRSLAVDGSLHAMGTPIFVTAPDLSDETGAPFRRLMIAQDVGSAILGPSRGDIFFGSGEEAGAPAGAARHEADFVVLLPKGA
jgi:peptidoglycan lytic transglycosylase A